MTLTFTLSEQTLTRTDSHEPVADSRNYLHIQVTGIGNQETFAVFRNRKTKIAVPLVGGSCEVPPAVIVTPFFTVSLLVGDLITTNSVTVSLKYAGATGKDVEDADSYVPDGVPWVERLRGAKGDKGDKGDTSAKGDAGANGRDGADGRDGVDGRDGLTTSVTVNGITHTQVDGDIDLGTVITEHQPLTDYRPASEQDVIDAGKLTEPALVSVGQYLRVAYIGDDGHAVLECVPAPSSAMQLKIAGSIQTPDSDGYVNVPYGGVGVAGVYKISIGFGLNVNRSNNLQIVTATDTNINKRHNHQAITSANIDIAVKAAMTDGKGTAWTDEERISALLRMGLTVDDNGFVKWTAQG